MSDYLHGAYGVVSAVGNRVAAESQGVIVYFGTAPVNQLALADGESYPVNKPILCNNIAEAKAAFGYSDNWEDYTLCEAMHVHFDLNGVGPLVLVNVLDPAKADHKNATEVSTSKTPVNGRITINSAEAIILETVTILTTAETPVTKEKGVDYNIAYNTDKKQIVIEEIGTGLGTDALTVKYYTVKPSGVTASDVIGTTDDMGLNTGLYCISDVYPLTGMIPSYMGAPGWSSNAAIHSAMYSVSKKVNGHWDVYMFADLPLMNGSTPLTLATVPAYKEGNGYNHDNETVYFPMALGTDGKKYHLSVLAAANFQGLLLQNDGVPFMVASNTTAAIIQNLWMGSGNEGRLYDDRIINKYLNSKGIASACFNSGAWRLWGCHSADFAPDNMTQINVSEVNMMMLFYVSNDFQARRSQDVDKPTTANDIQTIIAEEQTRIDALRSINALTYGEVRLNASAEAKADILMGDFSFLFDITPTPIARSLKAYVNWTDEGYTTYFEAFAET